jgi:3-oxoacyl-[acyl-carrier-protein] synthase II
MRRVAITGIGVVSSIGTGREAFWISLLEGKSGVGQVRSFDTSRLPVHLGAEIPDFEPEPYFRRLRPGCMGRASQLAVAAARLALEDAKCDARSPDRTRAGVAMGTAGESLFVERYNDYRANGDENSFPPEYYAGYPCQVIPGHIADEFDLAGPNASIPTACAAGNHAIGYGFDQIRANRADLMLCGGADSFSRIPYVGFARLGAIAPERCQPFDRNRKGMIPGEGAAVLVLEALDAALARGVRIYAELLGYGLTCDAHHMTASHPGGDGIIRAMAAAVRESGIAKEDVDYVSAHGTGTPTNDRVEAVALHGFFGPRIASIPISSIKSMIGHAMGAASAIEAAACALAVHTGWIPPTTNYEEPDSECALDCVPNRARQTNPRVVLNNAYAFGGNNACLCLRSFEGVD